jgi:4-amino-4-deoxy-L-arabinose transferase-like glycosyltransferase
MPRRAVQLLAVSILFWIALVVVGLVMRPPMPVDETRYLAVAWEMWRSSDYLVPRLNGIAYHHKPPLLFWLMNAGWTVIGVSEIWGRLVAPLFALGSMLLLVWLARLLFPATSRVAGVAPLAALGTALFAIFASLTFFDMMVTFFTLLGLVGVALAARGKQVTGWVLFALGIGLGTLSKGPVQLLDLLPVPLLAPLWMEDRPRSWARWYFALFLAVIGGAAIALAWAGPAALAGGPEFAHMLFIGQTTQRVVETMWHERPWWWYLPASFVMAFPWLWWPTFWRSLYARRVWRESGVRFCLCMIVPVFIVFSAISGKQPHYLLPMLTVFSLLLARFAVAGEYVDGRWWRLPPLLPILIVAVALLVIAPDPARFAFIHEDLADIPPVGVLGVVALAGLVVLVLVVILDTPRAAGARIGTMTAVIVALLVAVQVAVFDGLRPRLDGSRIAAEIVRAQTAGKPVANTNDYHGQYHFVGRLTLPVTHVHEHDAVAWAQEHPTGIVIDYRTDDPATYRLKPLFWQHWRGRFVVIWSAETLIAEGYNLLLDQRDIENRRR